MTTWLRWGVESGTRVTRDRHLDKVTVERVRIITARDALGDMFLQNRNADAPFLFE